MCYLHLLHCLFTIKDIGCELDPFPLCMPQLGSGKPQIWNNSKWILPQSNICLKFNFIDFRCIWANGEIMFFLKHGLITIFSYATKVCFYDLPGINPKSFPAFVKLLFSFPSSLCTFILDNLMFKFFPDGQSVQSPADTSE